MTESEEKNRQDKAEEKERPKKPPGYRNFDRLLKQVVKAPPLRRRTVAQDS